MDVPLPVSKRLWALSGNMCANPECRRPLSEEQTDSDLPVIIGDIAHITGRRKTSPRYDPTMSDEDRNGYDNLILLCKICHAKIDKQPNKYPAKMLQQMKRASFEQFNHWIKRETQSVTFTELESVMKYIMSGQAVDNTSFGLVAPADKIHKNGLSAEVGGLIKMGMSRAKEVKGYLDLHPDVQFGASLSAGFVNEYNRQKKEGFSGDTLFTGLWDYVAGADARRRVAGLVVLAYLFEACEVFER